MKSDSRCFHPKTERGAIMKDLIIGASITAAFVLIVVTAHVLITRYLFRAALEREEPPSARFVRMRIMNGAPLRDAVAALSLGAKALEEREHTVVSIKAHDNEELIGHYYTKKGAKRIVIAVHGWRSSWSRDFGIISGFFDSLDCNVLYVEQRGQNASGGQYMTFGQHERYDCRGWVKWVNKTVNAQGLPIYLAGVSMGASTVLMASGQKLPENVKGIISDCAFTSPHDIWAYVIKEKMRLTYRIRSVMVNDMLKKKAKIYTEYSTIDAMRDNRVPVLFIHGTDDKLVPVEMTYKNYIACAAKKELLVVPGADHGVSCYVDPERYVGALSSFFAHCESEHKAEQLSIELK